MIHRSHHGPYVTRDSLTFGYNKGSCVLIGPDREPVNVSNGGETIEPGGERSEEWVFWERRLDLEWTKKKEIF